MVESPTDLQSMQDALNRLFKLADTWQLGIAHKSVLLCLLAVTVWIVFLHLVPIVANASCVRDLGVLMDSNSSFVEHINHIAAKAHARACLIHIYFCLEIPLLQYVRLWLTFAHCWSIVPVSGLHTWRTVFIKLNLLRETLRNDWEDCLTYGIVTD